MEDFSLEQLNFESREAYDRAKKEAEFIRKAEETMDLSEGKTALKLYNKLVKEKVFNSIVGYRFLFELRETIDQTGVAPLKSLAPIPVREIIKTEKDTLEDHSLEVEKYKRLYEGQRLITTKFKIAIIVCTIILVGFVVVNLRMEYSVFTYFTNYKATMEEELIDKYQKWSDELQKREDALNAGKTASDEASAEEEPSEEDSGSDTGKE